MTTRDDEQRGNDKATHVPSVPHKLAHLLVIAGIAGGASAAGACGDDPVGPSHFDPDDIDGDGVPNDIDLCPERADPDQHDEDGDGVGDRCDVCPTVPDPLQADTTELAALQFEDGVGDACDPRPARAGDVLAALHTFERDSTAGWIGSGWSISGDRAHVVDQARWRHQRNAPGGGIVAEARFEITAWPGDGSISVFVDGDGTTGGMVCTVAHLAGAAEDQLITSEIGGESRSQGLGAPVAEGDELVLAAERFIDAQHRGQFGCRVQHRGRLTKLAVPTLDDMTLGLYGFAAEGVAASVSSLAVYTWPLPCAQAAGPNVAPACDR